MCLSSLSVNDDRFLLIHLTITPLGDPSHTIILGCPQNVFERHQITRIREKVVLSCSMIHMHSSTQETKFNIDGFLFLHHDKYQRSIRLLGYYCEVVRTSLGSRLKARPFTSLSLQP